MTFICPRCQSQTPVDKPYCDKCDLTRFQLMSQPMLCAHCGCKYFYDQDQYDRNSKYEYENLKCWCCGTQYEPNEWEETFKKGLQEWEDAEVIGE